MIDSITNTSCYYNNNSNRREYANTIGRFYRLSVNPLHTENVLYVS